MRRKHIFKIVTLVAIFCFANISSAADQLFLWGKIEWSSGTPAVGLEVRLVRNGNVIAENYSNTQGRYGFFDIEGKPADYEISILLGNEEIKQIAIPDNVAIAGEAPKVIIE